MTGATMWAVVAVRKQQPVQIVIAVPVSAPETCHELETEVHEIVCVSTPSLFYSVGLWYENFPQITITATSQINPFIPAFSNARIFSPWNWYLINYRRNYRIHL
ncbi:hypothetical protein PQG02_06470 [Nostoc sp. UHCC 0926]|uniref:hypothetical protein n=1 Tax=unclassified Nostoc TaxID=2593658 RepID=UPI00235F703D|nr:hypothetical protein [Nostoc sp. UHCC 0926]WDD33997.1 hypothetical protein PQG02_06470 [Nostoc sp. UHCC 0926]